MAYTRRYKWPLLLTLSGIYILMQPLARQENGFDMDGDTNERSAWVGANRAISDGYTKVSDRKFENNPNNGILHYKTTNELNNKEDDQNKGSHSLDLNGIIQYANSNVSRVGSDTKLPPQGKYGYIGWKNYFTKDNTGTVKKIIEGQKVRDVYYVKIHKTGSTTMQNVLFRYGLSNNLTFAMFDCPNAMSYPHPPKKEYLKHFSEGTTFNLLTHHTQFNPRAAHEYMSRDTVFMTLLRHPLQQLRSTLSYFELLDGGGEFKNGASFKRFLDNASRTQVKSFGCWPVERISLTQNPMAHHLGLEQQATTNPDVIADFIDTIDASMDIVLTLERFDESLLLMKRLFKWKLSDILHLSLFSSEFFKRSPIMLPPHAEELHRSHSLADYALYEHFAAKLDREINLQGELFQTELQDFKATQGHVKEFCITCCQTYSRVRQSSPGFARYTLMNQKQNMEASEFHQSFTVTCLSCLEMLVGTSLYLDAITVHQWPEECKTHPEYCSKFDLLGKFPFPLLLRSAYFNADQCRAAML